MRYPVLGLKMRRSAVVRKASRIDAMLSAIRPKITSMASTPNYFAATQSHELRRQ